LEAWERDVSKRARFLSGKFDMTCAVQAFARHRIAHSPVDEVARLREENEALKTRGVEAIIAYHVAICSLKGVVPVDSLYDPVLAANIAKRLEIDRKALDTLP